MGLADDHIERVAEWFSLPCPADEWVYRGQRAEYERLYPSVTRKCNQRFFANRLHNIEPRVAWDLLEMSPVLQPHGLLESGFLPELDLAKAHYLAFLPDPTSSDITLTAFLRALAQHYGFPTLFVDLTLDPWVALSFATHRYSSGGYQLSDTPGCLYRWPARRISASRLQISIPAADSEPRSVELFDISKCSAHMRRPFLQSSVLALPVVFPRFNPNVFATPGAGRYHPMSFDDLRFVDLLSLKSTESFLVDAGATEVLAYRAPSMEALFPDIIDLGYSYLTVIGLVSLTAMPPHPEDEFTADENRKERKEKTARQYADTIEAAAAILERECFRLVAGVGLSTELSRNIMSAIAQLRFQAELAVDAVKLMDSRDHSRNQRRGYRKLTRELSLRMLEELNPALAEHLRHTTTEDIFVHFDYSDGRFEVGPMKLTDRGVDWIEPEILRRTSRIECLGEHVGMVPAYVLENRKEHAVLLTTLDNDPEYEATVLRQLAVVRRFRPAVNLFPHFDKAEVQKDESG